MTTITRPCPHCGRDYDISRRLNGDQCWCPCGKWFRVVIDVYGPSYLLPCEPPPFLGAQETTEAAALVAEMSALRAELEAVKARERVLREALEQVPKMHTIKGARRAVSDALEAIEKERRI